VDGVFVLPSMQLVFGGVLCDEGMQKGGDQACRVKRSKHKLGRRLLSMHKVFPGRLHEWWTVET